MTRVFISYSHDSDTHKDNVLGLAERLRDDGFDAQIDQYVNGAPDHGWPRWMLDNIDAAQYVLVICTETYYRRFRGHEVPGKGKGVDWEGAIIMQEMYEERSQTNRFVPVLLNGAIEANVPEPMRKWTIYALTDETKYKELCAFLQGAAGVEPRTIGNTPSSERRRGKPLHFGNAPSNAPSHPAPPEKHDTPITGERLQVGLAYATVEIVVRGRIEDFTHAKQASIMCAIEKLLMADADLRVTHVRSGSVRLTVQVPEALVDDLMGVSGSCRKHGVLAGLAG